MTMSRRHVLGLGCGLAASSLLPGSTRAEGPPKRVDIGTIVEEPKLPLTTFLPIASTPLVALRFVFNVGSQDDPKGKEGLAALTAAMVAEGGTKDLSY